jgi:hypothetical protein
VYWDTSTGKAKKTMTIQVGLTILRLVLGLVAGGYSLALVVNQLRGKTHLALVLLGLAELAAAVLFLIPGTVRPGGFTLIVVFGAAALFHLLHGEYSVAYLAVYAAAAFAVVSGRNRT